MDGILWGTKFAWLDQLTMSWLIVVVEKPFVNTSAAADRLIALAKEKGKVLTVFHSMVMALKL